MQDTAARSTARCQNIYVIYSEIVEELGIDMKPGPMYKAEETRFTFMNKTSLIIGGNGGGEGYWC
jgi:hypothetical protein